MDSVDQRRKRKRNPRQPCPFSSSYFLSVKILVLCLGLLALLRLLPSIIPLSSSSFRPPVLVASSLSLLSSSSSRTVKSVQDFENFSLPWRVEDRVLFPDHVLLFVGGGKGDGLLKKSGEGELRCVYFDESVITKIRNGSFSWKDVDGFDEKKVISIDEFDGFRFIVRCPIRPTNGSDLVSLIVRGRNEILNEEIDTFWMNSRSVKSWENVVYAASLDEDTVVVFVKGLDLRPYRESNSAAFTCQFELEKPVEREHESMVVNTKALSAAQEVVRCPLPLAIKNDSTKAIGIRVAIRVTPNPRSRGLGHRTVPSVAKVSIFPHSGRHRIEQKHNLCVCTMVWNQEPAIREWIMYHSWLGIERWFIYDNNSEDKLDELIQKLDLEGYNVTRHIWPWIKTQEAGFSHCALRAKDECNWVSFMDVDEYFHLPFSKPKHRRFKNLGYAGRGSLSALVANVSAWTHPIGEIRTSCLSFGSSGLRSKPAQGVTVGYTCRLKRPERHKSIVRPDAVDRTLLNVVHHFQLKKGFRFLDLPQSTAVINHYKYQVWEVFREKFYRRVATYVVDWRENQNEGSRDRAPGLGTEAIEPPDWGGKFCEVWDTGMRDFVLSNLADLSSGLLPWERRRFTVAE